MINESDLKFGVKIKTPKNQILTFSHFTAGTRWPAAKLLSDRYKAGFVYWDRSYVLDKCEIVND